MYLINESIFTFSTEKLIKKWFLNDGTLENDNRSLDIKHKKFTVK